MNIMYCDHIHPQSFPNSSQIRPFLSGGSCVHVGTQLMSAAFLILPLYSLRKGLSVEPRTHPTVLPVWLASQPASWIHRYLPGEAGIEGRLPRSPDMYMDSADLNSGSLARKQVL